MHPNVICIIKLLLNEFSFHLYLQCTGGHEGFLSPGSVRHRGLGIICSLIRAGPAHVCPSVCCDAFDVSVHFPERDK